MPQPELSHRLQKAVLWPLSGYDAYGAPLSGPPVEIDVRWNTKRREVMGPQGTPIAIDASVVVGQRIAVGSSMWLGELADWYGTGSGSSGNDSEVMYVATYDEVPDLKNRVAARTAGLTRFRDAPPERG